VTDWLADWAQCVDVML